MSRDAPNALNINATAFMPAQPLKSLRARLTASVNHQSLAHYKPDHRQTWLHAYATDSWRPKHDVAAGMKLTAAITIILQSSAVIATAQSLIHYDLSSNHRPRQLAALMAESYSIPAESLTSDVDLTPTLHHSRSLLQVGCCGAVACW